MTSKTLCALALLALSGCGNDNLDPNYQQERVRTNSVRYDFPGPTYAYEFRLRDGTRCVALSSTAIDCDWQQPSGVER